jgi:hypothetical protein
MKLAAAEVVAADGLVQHLCAQVDAYAAAGDPLRDRYVGFCAVTVATHLETLVKIVILDFCKAQNRYLHSVFNNELQRLNGRISYQDLRSMLKRFDKGCDARFVRMVARLSGLNLAAGRSPADLIRSYDSLLEIRHSFVHNLNASFAHVTTTDLRSYTEAGKRVGAAFARSLK